MQCQEQCSTLCSTFFVGARLRPGAVTSSESFSLTFFLRDLRDRGREWVPAHRGPTEWPFDVLPGRGGYPPEQRCMRPQCAGQLLGAEVYFWTACLHVHIWNWWRTVLAELMQKVDWSVVSGKITLLQLCGDTRQSDHALLA